MIFKRRSFLKGCAAAAAALGLGGLANGPALASGGPKPDPAGFARKLLGAVAAIGPKPASEATKKANAAVLQELPFFDSQGHYSASYLSDFMAAGKGLVRDAKLPHYGQIPNPGTPPYYWNLAAYDFLPGAGASLDDDPIDWDHDAPPEANPSLWRQAQINMYNGLFEVADGVYQVRGQEMTNLTIVEGKKGIILTDPCSTSPTAAAALALYRAKRGDRPVVAVIYSHSHHDHYGGVKGVIDEKDVKAGKVQVLAPDKFLDAVISENVYAGTAMSRRAQYSYGIALPRGERLQIDVGLGKGLGLGPDSFIAPTDTITETGERRKIDGVEIVFQMTPDTEAPAEMTMFYPKLRVFNGAELACSLLHNVYTPRGAQVRDARAWSQYLDDAIEMFCGDADVMITQHNWPAWGKDAIIDRLKHERDMYKYMHDQTLRLANEGYTMLEIGEELARLNPLPKGLSQQWCNRGYYGSVSHNVKAIYQKYLGWYDCNPAHLESLQPSDAAKKYVEYMGGAGKVLDQARADFAAGKYRWVAEVVNHVVFADPSNQAARELQADALEQLGYQAESAIWRNQYLVGADELRNGKPPFSQSAASADVVSAMPAGKTFDYLGVRFNALAEGAGDLHSVMNLIFTDTHEKFVLNLENGALTYRADRQASDAGVTLQMDRAAWNAINIADKPVDAFYQAVQSGQVKVVAGDPGVMAQFLGLLDNFTPGFNIIEP